MSALGASSLTRHMAHPLRPDIYRCISEPRSSEIFSWDSAPATRIDFAADALTRRFLSNQDCGERSQVSTDSFRENFANSLNDGCGRGLSDGIGNCRPYAAVAAVRSCWVAPSSAHGADNCSDADVLSTKSFEAIKLGGLAKRGSSGKRVGEF